MSCHVCLMQKSSNVKNTHLLSYQFRQVCSPPEMWEETGTPGENPHKHKENTRYQNNRNISWHQPCCNLLSPLKFERHIHVWCTEAIIPTVCKQHVQTSSHLIRKTFKIQTQIMFVIVDEMTKPFLCHCWCHTLDSGCQMAAETWFVLGYSCFHGKPIHAYLLLESTLSFRPS